MTVNQGTVIAQGGKFNGVISSEGVYSLGVNTSSLVVNGGTLIAKAGSGENTVGVDLNAYKRLRVNGVTVQSDANGGAVQLQSEELHLYGGTMKLGDGSVIAKGMYVNAGADLSTWLDSGMSFYLCAATDQSLSELTNRNLELLTDEKTGEKRWLLSGNGEIWVQEREENAARECVPYLDADGVEQDCGFYQLLNSSEGSVTLSDGWYVVRGNVTIGGELTLEGADFHLILCDEAALTVKGGITRWSTEEERAEEEADEDSAPWACNRLTIYAQSTGEKMGKLAAEKTKDFTGVDYETADGRDTHSGGIGIYGDLIAKDSTVTATAGGVVLTVKEGGEYRSAQGISSGIKLYGGEFQVDNSTVKGTSGGVTIFNHGTPKEAAEGESESFVGAYVYGLRGSVTRDRHRHRRRRCYHKRCGQDGGLRLLHRSAWE